jgi:hypothetical protein
MDIQALNKEDGGIENYLISSEISIGPRRTLEPPKLFLTNSPENYFPSPEKIDIQVNTSS